MHAVVSRAGRYGWLATVVVASLAGWLASRVGIPAAWFVAPLLVGLVVALLAHARLRVPSLAYLGSQAVIGVAASATFEPSTVEALTHHWLPVVAVVSAVILLSLISGVVLARTSGVQVETALLGALPGGAPAMVATSDALNADGRLVAFMQYLRVLVVIFSTSVLAHFLIEPIGNGMHAPEPVPLRSGEMVLAYGSMALIALVGGWVGERLGLPAGAMVGPSLLGALVGGLGLAHGALPAGSVEVSSVVVGVQIGLRFTRDSLGEVRRLALPMLFGTLFLVIGAALLGWLLTLVTDIDLLTAYLAAIPGGIQAVTIIALDSGANSSFVITVHLIRFLVIVLVGPHLVRWLVRSLATTDRQQRDETAATPDPNRCPPPPEIRRNRH